MWKMPLVFDRRLPGLGARTLWLVQIAWLLCDDDGRVVRPDACDP